MVTSWKGVTCQAVSQAEKAEEFIVLNCGYEQTDLFHVSLSFGYALHTLVNENSFFRMAELPLRHVQST